MLSLFPEAIEQYAREHSSAEDPLFHELAKATHEKTDMPQMMVGNTEGILLRSLVRMSGARRILEVGTFTGYSALAMAVGLPDDGVLVTCDIDPDATAIAQSFWDRSPHGSKIQLRLGPALETITALEEPLDLVFIDADKQNYINYWDACVPRLRPNGVIVVDNVLWSGRVIDPAEDQEDETRAIVAFNKHVRSDNRVEHVMLSVRDGITVAVRT